MSAKKLSLISSILGIVTIVLILIHRWTDGSLSDILLILAVVCIGMNIVFTFKNTSKH